MKPYDTTSRADLFAGPEDVFDAVVAELSGPRTATLTHAQLEELVAARGRELLRQLVPDHLDLRAAREEQAVALLHRAGVARRPAPTAWCAAASKPVIIGCWPPSSAR